MAKGMFTQCMCLLTDGRTTLDHIKAALVESEFEIVRESTEPNGWRFGGESVVVAYQPRVNGYISVDVVKERWPDSMGDPKSEAKTFGAWSMGFFGPLTFPFGLARAGQHSWSWEAGKSIAEKHRGFIRLRLSYAFGAKDDTPLLPPEYDPLGELQFLSGVVLALFDAPGVICYFNPSGEVLRDKESFREIWDACEEQQNIPLPLWMNVRLFNLNDQLCLMDTVGNGQLDLQDVEAIFSHAEYDPGDIDYYLRNVTHYLMNLDRPLDSGEEIDGPGESNLSWTAEAMDESVVPPPRRLVRLFPKVNRKEIQAALGKIKGA